MEEDDSSSTTKNGVKDKIDDITNPKKSKKLKKKKSRKRKHSSSSCGSDDEPTIKKSKSKHKKKCKKRHKHVKDKKHKLKDKSDERSKSREKEKTTVGPEIPSELLQKSQSMAPMSKEEWEKRQNTIRRVYDEETGRTRLVRGEGEIIEEIVSRERHQDINRRATQGDGDFFQSKLKKLV